MADETVAERVVAGLKRDVDRAPRVNPFSWMIDKICGVNLDEKSDPFPKGTPAVLRIALVSMPHLQRDTDFSFNDRSSLPNVAEFPKGVDEKCYTRTLASVNPGTAARMFKTFSDSLDAALKYNPHVICFNEMGLPSEGMIPMDQAKELAWEKSQEHQVLIIAGSAHDSRTLYNTAYFFRPGGPKDGESFHKHISARDEGELISAPASRTIRAIKFAGFRIAMVICLDVVDYGSIASVVKVADGLEVVLGVCYTPKFDDIASVARVASRAMPGLVALVNASGPEWQARCCNIARFGENEAPLKTKTLKKLGAEISLVEINRVKFQERRIDMTTRPREKVEGLDPEKKKRAEEREEMDYLFGRRDMPVRTA